MTGRNTITLLIAMSIIPLAACESTLDVDHPGDSLPVALDFGIIRQGVEPPFEIVQTSPLVLRGYFETLCSGYTASASALKVDSTVVITITAHVPDACHPVVSAVGYQVVVTVDSSAFSMVKVVHTDAGRVDTVYRSGPTDSVAVLLDTMNAIQTTAHTYALTASSIFLQTHIPYMYRNVLADTLYIRNCGGSFGLALQQKQGAAWVDAWGPVVPACLGSPIVIPPGGRYEATINVEGARPGHNTIPEFPAGNLDGPYRIVFGTSVVLHYKSAAEVVVDEKYRTSNSFFLDDPQ